jgi:hypothetical protein
LIFIRYTFSSTAGSTVAAGGRPVPARLSGKSTGRVLAHPINAKAIESLLDKLLPAIICIINEINDIVYWPAHDGFDL